MNYDYGGVYKEYDMTGEIELPHNSRVAVCDWIESLPAFMHRADTLFIDPPWNNGNVTAFYTKADKEYCAFDFLQFTQHLFARIDTIAPATLFVEMGKQYLAHYIVECQKRYKYVTFYNSTYYHKKENKCYIIHATNSAKHRRYKVLEDMDEENVIEWICTNHAYECIGDLCMGRGLVGKHAYHNHKPFVGTELNYKRLAVLVDYITKAEQQRHEG